MWQGAVSPRWVSTFNLTYLVAEDFKAFSENFESELIGYTEELLAYLHQNQRWNPNKELNNVL